jgi:hypothetical protein
LVEPQNQGRQFVSDFGLKTTRTIFAGLASKPVTTVSPSLASKLAVGFLVEPQNQGKGFLDWASKLTATGLVI